MDAVRARVDDRSGCDMNQDEVLARLAEVSALLDAAVADVKAADERFVQAKQQFELAQARSFLSSEGSVEARKQKMVLDAEQQQTVMDAAGVELRAGRERVSVLRAQLSMLQTVSAALRQQWQAEATGQWT